MPSQNKKMVQRQQEIKNEREQLLSLQPAEALERLLASPRALEIVHSIPAQDLHVFIHDIGMQDALPILALASNRQWEYILDSEIWYKDRLDPVACTKWLHMLLAADPQRLATWCVHEKAIFTELFLFQNIEIRIREHDQSPSDFGDDFVTFDDTIYFRILDPVLEPSADADADKPDPKNQYAKDRKIFLHQLLQRIAHADHQRYQGILLESASLLPAETEEEAYRTRNVRLAEEGFLPFEEAVGMYQPLNPETLKRRPQSPETIPPETATLEPVPFLAAHLLASDNAFARGLASIDNAQVCMQMQSEFAGLCNQLLVADQTTITGRDDLNTAVRKVAGYVSIGLESISENHADAVQNFLLADIFRVGYGRVLALKWRAENWHRESWCLTQGLPLSFWDEKGLGVVGGLLIKRPLFFDDYQSGTLYREFENMEDITTTETVLTNIIKLDSLLANLRLQLIPSAAANLLTYKNLLLTHWARTAMVPEVEENSLTPLSLDEFKSFFKALWRTKTKPRQIRMTTKSNFLKWIASQSDIPASQIADTNGPVLEDLFNELEQELGSVSTKDLDPHFTNLFLLK